MKLHLWESEKHWEFNTCILGNDIQIKEIANDSWCGILNTRLCSREDERLKIACGMIMVLFFLLVSAHYEKVHMADLPSCERIIPKRKGHHKLSSREKSVWARVLFYQIKTFPRRNYWFFLLSFSTYEAKQNLVGHGHLWCLPEDHICIYPAYMLCYFKEETMIIEGKLSPIHWRGR